MYSHLGAKKRMNFSWTVGEQAPEDVKAFLKEKGVSRRMLAKVKFHGGELRVNDQLVRVREVLQKGDRVCVTMPIEAGNPYLTTSEKPLDILFEDEHYLVVNKPVGVVSVPSPAQREETMANRVKGYIEREKYEHQTVHVITRLDKDTSGVMLFAKHGLAHSMMDKQLREKTLTKMYEALVEGQVVLDHGWVNAPIARSESSIIERKVKAEGKSSLSEYWVEERFSEHTKVTVQLHTGRTHQIRVHFSHIGHPLVGDDLYGGSISFLERQALHCKTCSFFHPFLEEEVTVHAPLPKDMAHVIEKVRGKDSGKKTEKSNEKAASTP